MLTRLKVLYLAHKCVFYRADLIGKVETHGTEISSL